MRFSVLCVGILMSVLTFNAFSDTTIVLLRHGEKPVAGLGQLNCKGFNRSLALPAVLLSRYGQPTVLFAPNPSILKDDHGTLYPNLRPFATIEPTAVQTGKSVNIQIGLDDLAELKTQLSQLPDHSVAFVAWNHKNLPKLAKALLADKGLSVDIPAWPEQEFDQMFVLRLKSSSASFSVDQQGLNGISDICLK